MKTKVLVSAAIMFLCCCSTAMAQWPHSTYGQDTGWEVEVGTRILDRPGTDLPFVLVTTVPTNQTVFNANDASELGVSAGAEFRFQKKTGYDGAWEIRTAFNNWDNFETRTGNLRAPLFTPAALPALSRPDRFDYGYESDLFNFELNFKRTVRPGMTFLIGPRFVHLDETTTIETNFINPGIPAFSFDLDTVTTATNSMPGLGFGLEFRRPIVNELFFVGSVKGAILANFVETNTTSTGTVIGGVPNQQTIFDDSATHAAGIGEFSARMHYDWAPGTVSLYAGYDAMWLDGVALAPAQLLSTITPPISINTSSTSFAHGAVFGAMIRF